MLCERFSSIAAAVFVIGFRTKSSALLRTRSCSGRMPMRMRAKLFVPKGRDGGFHAMMARRAAPAGDFHVPSGRSLSSWSRTMFSGEALNFRDRLAYRSARFIHECERFYEYPIPRCGRRQTVFYGPPSAALLSGTAGAIAASACGAGIMISIFIFLSGVAKADD